MPNLQLVKKEHTLETEKEYTLKKDCDQELAFLTYSIIDEISPTSFSLTLSQKILVYRILSLIFEDDIRLTKTVIKKVINSLPFNEQIGCIMDIEELTENLDQN